MPISDWPDLLWSDYPTAAIRLTTLEHGDAVHLLFGYVELVPAEIPPPSPYRSRALNLFNGSRVRTSLAVIPSPDAVAWYEKALSGQLEVPGALQRIAVWTVSLGAEPKLGRFISASTPPVSASWHAVPRIHRLVPMESLPAVIVDVLAQPEGSPRRTKIAGWLEANAFIDLCRNPDCAGGMVMLAPNPVLRSCHEYLGETRADGSEVIRVKAVPRTGHSPNNLSVRIRENRPDGVSMLKAVPLDEFGAGECVFPERISETSLEITCPERGLLSVVTPCRFVRAIHVDMKVIRSTTEVEIPARRKGQSLSRHSVSGSAAGSKTHVGEPDPPPSGEARLARLLAARISVRQSGTGEMLFIDDRTAAVAFVRGLVWPASKRVTFVDPYFDVSDVREFALSVGAQNCAVEFLTGRQEPKWTSPVLHLDPPQIRGHLMSKDLQHINEVRKRTGCTPIVGKVMGGAVRSYHDRFLVVDDAVWHFGHSFNALADGTVSMAMRLEHPEKLLAALQVDLDSADSFEDYWQAVKPLAEAPLASEAPM